MNAFMKALLITSVAGLLLGVNPPKGGPKPKKPIPEDIIPEEPTPDYPPITTFDFCGVSCWDF